MVTVSITADNITGTRQLRLEVGSEVSAGTVARSTPSTSQVYMRAAGGSTRRNGARSSTTSA